MNKRFATHDTFVIEKIYNASPEQVFTAWSDSETKAKWFQKADEFNFRVGGREYSQGGPKGGPVFTFDACYQEIVSNQRIVYSYTMDLEETRISVSLTTVEFRHAEAGTQLIYTEQGVFLDGHDTVAQREHGTRVIMDKLGEYLQIESIVEKN
ncbi:SRPBCC family protein [Fictibacillus fluitans]|uniref:SRPBCC family protein n=1 Tax=Fictibacillus fluitans TaxID=3058422 RepID=A0ABT8I027_9BACL|nr:SRPBCC family protein [Fictibacillus sp. NE201]MDN4526377.1 SRPBCC family protein [Fictibacillus sp. NE201]